MTRTPESDPSSTIRRGVRRGVGRIAALSLFLVVVGGSLAVALRAQVPDGWGWRVPEGWAGGRWQREMVPSKRQGFYGCKLMYDRVRSEASGRGWDTDYPMAIRNLMWRLGEFTTTSINQYEDGEMADGVVRATDPGLFQCPFLMAADIGTAGFSSEEVEALRQYFLRGGFLWVDDFWGQPAMDHWLRQLSRILPEYERVILDREHPLMSTFYFIEEVPQMPNIGFWRRSGGQTSERGLATATPTLSAIVDESGRAMVVMTHNTDIGDGMERESEDHEFFLRFSPHAYAMAINIAIYAMTR
jgi:hypothetical protein